MASNVLVGEVRSKERLGDAICGPVLSHNALAGAPMPVSCCLHSDCLRVKTKSDIGRWEPSGNMELAHIKCPFGSNSTRIELGDLAIMCIGQVLGDQSTKSPSNTGV